MPTELALGTSQVNCEVNFKLCVEKLTLFTCSHGLCSSLNVTGEGKRDFLEGIVSFGELYTSEWNVCFSDDMNGHIESSNVSYDGTHGGFGYGDRNADGSSTFKFADGLNLVICNTLFMKQESQLVTYAAGPAKSTVDYIIVQQEDKAKVHNVKDIPNEECVTKHKLLVMDMWFNTTKRWHKKFEITDKEEKTCQEYQSMVKDKVAKAEWKYLDVNENWQQMKNIMMETAQVTCWLSKGPCRHMETWWWNVEVAERVREKKKKYGNWENEKSTEEWKEYKKSRQNAKRVISLPKEKKQKECVNDLNDPNHQNELFK